MDEDTARLLVGCADVASGGARRLMPSEPKQLITAENIDATSGLSWSAK